MLQGGGEEILFPQQFDFMFLVGVYRGGGMEEQGSIVL